jgi:ATP-dependent Lon protease
VGSTWGKIVEGIIDSKCMNPIIYIDELDKISKTEHGRELIGILTHLTDPAQNQEFMDKYFSGIPIDLSKCLIIFSYNDPDLIDKILLDRIQRINIEPLNKMDKLMVAKDHIIPEILNNIGLSSTDIAISDTDLLYIIERYTYEAGARKLKEKLYELYREINLNYLQGNYTSFPIKITNLVIDTTFYNCDKIDITYIHKIPKIGWVNGLYATSSGLGGITIIESTKFASTSHLELKLTGMQGDVMKESMNVAKTLALNLIPNKIADLLKDKDNTFGIHIHCPAGATPKDGPSAGTAITLSILSILCSLPIRNDVGITGEISLNGSVLPIGGLESKIEGGLNAGVKLIVCPKANEKDLVKIKNKTNIFHPVKTIDNIYEAIDELLILPDNMKAIEYFKQI